MSKLGNANMNCVVSVLLCVALLISPMPRYLLFLWLLCALVWPLRI